LPAGGRDSFLVTALFGHVHAVRKGRNSWNYCFRSPDKWFKEKYL